MAVTRIGILGAARIVRTALLAPARHVDGVAVAAVAARAPARARAYAAKHRIPQVHDSYQALLADPAIDAVYIPTPASLHARWTLAALEAGKHVLVEKPFTANAVEAERVAAAAAGSDRVVMEAYHTGHHPLTARLREILGRGEIGTVRAARAFFYVPIPPGRNIRWDPALAGGGLLDVGYYPVRLLRDLFGEPTVSRGRALQRSGVDRYLEADLVFPGDIRATVRSSLWSRRLLGAGLRVDGDRGRLSVSWPYHPQVGARITIRSDGRSRKERADRTSTYIYQLRAFRDAVQNGGPILTGAPAAVLQMRTLDAIYRACGLEPRCLP
ncbi:Gfo/Idh/MocA family oxidoreductase [Actinoplanes sp. NBC_00393]|uniref:Gfo/Idh/MocA family protein n=1 Tax=Actinoplanes sp. NBC_00393 TaxID=2975953 RepID=UPI002E1D6D1F